MTGASSISAEEKARRISRKAEVEKEKRDYLERKRKMVPFEQRNYDKIALFRATKGFYVIGGHSAIILSELVAPDIKMKVVLRKDSDFECAFREGIISVKDVDFYKTTLPRSSLIKKEYKETEQSLVFYLKDILSLEQYDLISHTEEIKSAELMNLASSSVVMPGLYKKVRELTQATFVKTNKIDKFAQDTIGKELMDNVVKLERAFLLGARTESEIEDALNDIEYYAHAVHVTLKIVEDMGIWRAKECWRIGSLTSQIIAQIPVERKAYKLKQQ